jgi:S-(hydroxymethyl)glutathione dehydrogenase/alcohol dehydrogenase
MLASGICHSDLHRASGDWGPVEPVVLGHEGAGVVEAIGPGVDPALLGRTVALNWRYPCGHCAACADGETFRCTGSASDRNLQADGTTRLRTPAGEPILAYLSIGTFAEREVVPAAAAVPLPETVPPEVIALIGCCVATGVCSVTNAAAMPEGATAVVVGLGGVGMSALMGAARLAPTTLVAVDTDPRRLRVAGELGATELIEARSLDETVARVARAVGDDPAYLFEASGHPQGVEVVLAAAPRGATIVLIGMPPLGERASFEITPFVDRAQRIVGANYGRSVPDVDFPRIAGWYLDGSLPLDRLVEARVSLDDVNDGLDALRRGDGLRRVIVFG